MPQELLIQQIRDSIIDPENHLVRLSFSSEKPLTRQSFFSEPWGEVLGHADGEVDFERLNNSAPLLYNHDRSKRDNRIGVVERAWIEKGRGYAEVHLSKRAEVKGLWQDVRDGILAIFAGGGFQMIPQSLRRFQTSNRFIAVISR